MCARTQSAGGATHLPEEVRAREHGAALVGLAQQLGRVAGRLVHKRRARLGREDAAAVQRAHHARQRDALAGAVRDGLLEQHERLPARPARASAVLP